MLIRLLQSSKAPVPIFFTLSGISIYAKPVQPAKALCPISVTLSGITTLVRPVVIGNFEFPNFRKVNSPI